MAKKANIPFRTLQDIIYKSTSNPGIKSIILIAESFNLTLDELVLKDLSK